MEIGFLTVMLTVIAMVILAVPAFILEKCKCLPQGASKAFSAFMLFACQPFLTFMSFQRTDYNPAVLTNMLITAGFAFAAHFLMVGLVVLLFAKKKDDARIRVVRFASVFGNCGFFGLPFLKSLFDTGEMLIYAAVFVAVYNLLSWTVGIWLITGDKKYVRMKKAFLNPPFIALCISLPLFIILKQPISQIGAAGTFLNDFFVKLSASFNLLADMTTPLSMSIVGIRLAQMNLKQLFANGWVYCSSALKLAVFPLLAFGMMMLFPSVSVVVKCCVFFSCAMPTATQTLLFSEQYGGDPYTASPAVLLNTCLCIVTIPLMSLLLGFL